MKKDKLKRMLFYGAADTMGGGVGQVMSLYYMVFLSVVMGLPPALAGATVAIGKIWDGVTDPMMGVIVDRTRNKRGSCRPWLLWSAIPFFVSYFMLWYCFGITSEWGKFFYFSFAYVFYSTTYTMAIVPYEAMLPRMVDSYSERTDYASTRMIFSGVGCVATTFLYDMIVKVPTGEKLSPAYADNYILLGVVFAAFFTIPLLVTYLGTKEPPRLDAVTHTTIKDVFKNYGQILKCSHYKKYYALSLLGALVGSCATSTLAYFAMVAFPNMTGFSFLGITLTFVFLSVTVKGALEIGFFPLNVFLMKKYNKQRPYLVDLPLIILAAISMAFVRRGGGFAFYAIAICVVGAGVSCLGFVPMNLLPDLSDVDELIYGKRREGMNAGLTTMGKKIVSGLTIALFGVVLGAFGVEEGSTDFDNNALLALKMIFCVLPVIACVIMLIISKGYKIDKSNHALIKRILADKHANGFAEATDDEKRICEEITGFKWEDMWISTVSEPDAPVDTTTETAAEAV